MAFPLFFLPVGIPAEEIVLFDGESLVHWEAGDPSYWKVEDGAITAESTEMHPCKKNQFLVWQGGTVTDFTLQLEVRVIGGPKANSGIQVRSSLDETGHAVGYQADISQPEAPWLGAIYDEHGRKMLAKRGESTVLKADGSRETVRFGEEAELVAAIDLETWTPYEIRCQGPRMSVWVNGVKTAEITDLDEKHRELSGILALQLHSGPPMKVQFRNLRLLSKPAFSGEASETIR
ncbi:MAG: DUF1080 domain-containing protein [Verrucomicrobiota bacterium]